jgi:hypothetical protein
VSFETEQFRRLEKSNPREFWDSPAQCPCGNLPPEANLVRKMLRQGNFRAKRKKTAKNTLRKADPILPQHPYEIRSI